jgi:hypothetical protein
MRRSTEAGKEIYRKMMEQILIEDAPQQQLEEEGTKEEDIEVEDVQIRLIGTPTAKHSQRDNVNIKDNSLSLAPFQIGPMTALSSGPSNSTQNSLPTFSTSSTPATQRHISTNSSQRSTDKSPSSSSTAHERDPTYRINIGCKPNEFVLPAGTSLFNSKKEATIDFSKQFLDSELPSDSHRLSLNKDITVQLVGFDEEGCLMIPFLPGGKNSHTFMGFMTGLQLKSDYTSNTYGLKMRPRWGVTTQKWVPQLPTAFQNFTASDQINFKKLLVTKNIWGWMKDQSAGELCVHCLKEEALAFITEVKRRLAQLKPIIEGGTVDAELFTEPPIEENIHPYIWVKLPGLILRQLGLIMYVYASSHVFVVDSKESLLLLGKMPFTKNLQPPQPSKAAAPGAGGSKKRKRT